MKQVSRECISAVRKTYDHRPKAEHNEKGEEDGEEAEDAAPFLVPEQSSSCEICRGPTFLYPVVEEGVITRTAEDRSQVF